MISEEVDLFGPLQRVAGFPGEKKRLNKIRESLESLRSLFISTITLTIGYFCMSKSDKQNSKKRPQVLRE